MTPCDRGAWRRSLASDLERLSVTIGGLPRAAPKELIKYDGTIRLHELYTSTGPQQQTCDNNKNHHDAVLRC